jgi:hypothetical protein
VPTDWYAFVAWSGAPLPDIIDESNISCLGSELLSTVRAGGATICTEPATSMHENVAFDEIVLDGLKIAVPGESCRAASIGRNIRCVTRDSVEANRGTL